MQGGRPSSDEIYDEAERILNLSQYKRDLVLADIWLLAGNRCVFTEGDIKNYLREVRINYQGWRQKDFAVLFYVITGEEIL